MARRTFCYVLLFLVISNSSSAQQVVPPGQFTIGGMPFQCGAIPTVLYPFGGDVATATPGAINLNWPLFSSYPIDVQEFVYAHECAHHLGADESAADCWAIKTGLEQGFLNESSISDICASVYVSPGDWTHFPGPIRCSQMLACFNQNK